MKNKIVTFEKVLAAYGERSTCERANVAAIIVRNGRIVSTGYVGSPSGMPHCTDVGCEIGPDGGCIRTIHAEANAIAFAAKDGIKTDECIMFTSMAPCYSCAKLIIQAGIKAVYFFKQYREQKGIDLLIAAGVKFYDLSAV